MATLRIDRGDRLTLRTAVTRTGTDPAPPLEFCVVSGDWTADDWFAVAPVVDSNPAVYEVTVAYGSADDFAAAHPAGTRVITTASKVWMRPVSGHDIDVQLVAWIRVRA